MGARARVRSRAAIGQPGVGSGAETRAGRGRPGNTVTYPGAVNGAELVYRVTARGVKEEIVLRRAPADPVYRFRARLGDGMTAKQREDGVIGFYRAEAGSRPVMTIPAPFHVRREDRQRLTETALVVVLDLPHYLAQSG